MNDDDLFKWSESEERRRDAAIAQVESHNEGSKNEEAFQSMLSVLRSLPFGDGVTSDQLLPDLEPFQFSDNRAVGPLMIRLKREGYIVPTNQMVKSKRTGNHCAPRMVYSNQLNAL